MQTLKNYLIETNIFLIEAKLPEFVNKYIKFHSNHPLVKEDPEKARELIAGAHKHANDHDEAAFLTQNLLNGFYKPEEDDMTMSNVVRTWRSAKAKNLISPETKLTGMDHDSVMEMFKRIPELADVKVGMGSKQRGALKGLEPYKIGTIDHPEHGKLTAYNFNKDNLSDDKEREIVRGHFKNLCSGTHYTWCVLATPDYMKLYSQRGPGFFTYVNSDGRAVISHGHGDRATNDNPGGVVVDPKNETHPYQREVKRQTYELLPREKQIEYGLNNNVMDESEIKSAVADLHKIYTKEDRVKDILKLPTHTLKHLEPHMLDDLYNSFLSGIEKDNYISFEDHRDLTRSDEVTRHFADKILSKPQPNKQDLTILRHLHFNSAKSADLRNKEFDFVHHPNVSIRRAFAASRIPYDYASTKQGEMSDDAFDTLLQDPDPGVRHNIITGENMRGGRAKKFIFESGAPEDEKINALFSSGIVNNTTNPLKQEDVEKHFSDPAHESFFTKAIHIDASYVNPPYGDSRRFDTIALKKIYEAYRHSPSSEIMEAIVSHPDIDPEHYKEIMATTASKDVKIAGLKNKNADETLVHAHIADPDKDVRVAAITSPKADLEHFHRAVYTERDPQLQAIFANKFRNRVTGYSSGDFFQPTQNIYDYRKSKNTITPQMKRNRNYALSSGDELLLGHVYNAMAGDNNREDVVGEHLVSPSTLMQHMQTDWDSNYTKETIQQYWRSRKNSYQDSQQHFNNEEEKNNFISKMDELTKAETKPRQISVRDIQKIQENNHKIFNPKKQLNRVALNQIMKYFREL